MRKFLISSLTFAIISIVHAVDPIYFVQNQKGLDYKFTGKKDEHRFGVELTENQQFHHTVTAEDGVRLGCYGYTLNGRKYSTHYVADFKGYRIVPHNAKITVYPKNDGEPRQASFVGAFGDGDVRAANIRYLFPEGCQAPRIEIDAATATAAGPSKTTGGPSKTGKRSNDESVGKTNNELAQRNGKGINTNVLENDRDKVNSKNPNKNDEEKKKILNDNNLTSKNGPAAVGGYQYGKQSSSLPSSTNGSCCDDSKPQIILPHANDANGCGKSVAKIVIPIDLSAIQKISMNEIVELASEKVNIEIIRKLLKLAEKYQI